MKRFNPKQYLEALSDFLKEWEVHALAKKTITSQEQIVDLFRFWYMDCREQEAYKEAVEREEGDPFGLGDILGGD